VHAGLTILLTIILNVCAHILLTSMKMDIDNIIVRVRSAYNNSVSNVLLRHAHDLILSPIFYVGDNILHEKHVVPHKT